MQDIDQDATLDLIVSLSWTLNYCEDRAVFVDVLRRFHRALRPGGQVLLQVAHAAHVDGRVMEDREPGPGGEPDDVIFLYRFARLDGEGFLMRAEYVYACKSLNELIHEQHLLRMADASAVARCTQEAGFVDVVIYDSWRRDPSVAHRAPLWRR